MTLPNTATYQILILPKIDFKVSVLIRATRTTNGQQKKKNKTKKTKPKTKKTFPNGNYYRNN